jgi:hypothetical protein
MKLASTELWYGAPNGNNSEILAPFYDITAVSDNTKTRSYSSYTIENEAVITYGAREIYYVVSVKASYEISKRSVDIFYDAISEVSAVDGILPALVWQHITDGSLKASKRNGGNAMGFDSNGSPIQVIQISCSWNNAADDDAVNRVMSNIMRDIKKASVELGVQNDWVYMNYAAKFQDVIASYGASKKKLKTIAKKYDPKEVFQKLQPGYFKLDGAPKPDARYFSH